MNTMLEMHAAVCKIFHSVIPAQAGIQSVINLRAADKPAILSRFAGAFNHLDSGLHRNDGCYKGLS